MSLPNELLAKVADHTPAASVLSLHATCRRLRDVTKEHNISKLNEGRLARMRTDSLKRMMKQAEAELVSRVKKQRRQEKKARLPTILRSAIAAAQRPPANGMPCAFLEDSDEACDSAAQFKCSWCETAVCYGHIEDQLCMVCETFAACDECVTASEENAVMDNCYKCNVRLCHSCWYEMGPAEGSAHRACPSCATDF